MDSFFTLSLDGLQRLLVGAGFEKFRAKQVFDAVYKNRVFDPQNIPTIPQKLKDWLGGNLEFAAAKLVGNRESEDETKKYLFALSDGYFVESVLLEGGPAKRSA